MKNWMFLTGDINWEDHGAKWAKCDPVTGAWWILDFENKEEWGDGAIGYYCGIKYVDLTEVPPETIADALRSCGWSLELSPSSMSMSIVNDYDGTEVASGDAFELCLIHSLVGYGVSAPMGSEEGRSYPLRVRARARRFANGMMQDTELTAEALARPVNQLGSTAADFGRGDCLAGVRRVADKILQGESDAESNTGSNAEVSTKMSLVLRVYAAAGGQTLGGVKETGLAAAGRALQRRKP